MTQRTHRFQGGSFNGQDVDLAGKGVAVEQLVNLATSTRFREVYARTVSMVKGKAVYGYRFRHRERWSGGEWVLVEEPAPVVPEAPRRRQTARSEAVKPVAAAKKAGKTVQRRAPNRASA